MKKQLILSILFLTFLLPARAQVLEAKPFKDLMELIETSKLNYKERGMVFGFNTIQSCLYVSDEVIIFKNYCYPVRNYPARGYTIISEKFGMIDLYEEQLHGVLQRAIRISEFPEILSPYLTTPFPEATLMGLSAMMEKIHYQYNPGCWSTNYSSYSEVAEANCTVDTQIVVGFEAWSEETQTILNDVEKWYALMNQMESTINQYQQ